MKFAMFSRARANHIREAVILWSGMQASFIVQMVHLESRSKFTGVTPKHFLVEITILLMLALAGLATLYKRQTIERSEAIQAIAITLILSIPSICFCVYRL
jgi:hypothetical protein